MILCYVTDLQHSGFIKALHRCNASLNHAPCGRHFPLVLIGQAFSLWMRKSVSVPSTPGFSAVLPSLEGWSTTMLWMQWPVRSQQHPGAWSSKVEKERQATVSLNLQDWNGGIKRFICTELLLHEAHYVLEKNIAAVQWASGTHLPFLIVSWHPRMEINLSKSQHHFSHDFHNIGIFVGRMMLVI